MELRDRLLREHEAHQRTMQLIASGTSAPDAIHATGGKTMGDVLRHEADRVYYVRVDGFSSRAHYNAAAKIHADHGHIWRGKFTPCPDPACSPSKIKYRNA